MVIEVTLDKGAVVPMHDHPHEQVGYVVRGRVQFVINGETLIAETGDSYAIAGGIPHEATALEDSVVIDVFSPPREEYR
jgi:quercetin dioxygenase-like cupin family protein